MTNQIKARLTNAAHYNLFTLCALTHCMQGNFSCFFVVCRFFFKINFLNFFFFRNNIRMSVGVGPDLGPNCLPRLSEDNTDIDKELKICPFTH